MEFFMRLVFTLALGVLAFCGVYSIELMLASPDEPPSYYEQTRHIAKSCDRLYPDDKAEFTACVDNAMTESLKSTHE